MRGNCPLEQLPSGKWVCPLCDPHHKRVLPANSNRNCQAKSRKPPSPGAAQSKATEVPNRARARRLVCLECPENNWDAIKGFCPMMAGRPCQMRSLLNGPRHICKHWPE
jgi:hypothetical protein